jgi:hypothetical protein
LGFRVFPSPAPPAKNPAETLKKNLKTPEVRAQRPSRTTALKWKDP